MNHYRLLDADFLINLIRTLSLIKEYDSTTSDRINQICNRCHYSLVSTNYVQNEVNNKIKLQAKTSHDLFFEPTKRDALKIKKDIFDNVRFVDMRKNQYMSIFESISPRNLGEKSLVVLLSSRYAKEINSGRSTAKIVSNNSKDVVYSFNKIKAANEYASRLDVLSTIQPNYEFYYELFSHLKFDKPFRFYYYFVSNIDARVYDKGKIEQLLFNEA
jgi:hypothetical protein